MDSDRGAKPGGLHHTDAENAKVSQRLKSQIRLHLINRPDSNSQPYSGLLSGVKVLLQLIKLSIDRRFAHRVVSRFQHFFQS